ncbi:MAG TPA: DUF6062 family protein [Bacteroidota bacterium]|nr:DUF6062 family protein [Bacteroidota bacterium]
MKQGKENIPPEKFTGYYNVLDACGQKGCPVCILSRQGVRRYVDNLLYENVNDPATRKMLRSSLGFCFVHSQLLLQAGDALGVSILYADIIHEVESALSRQSLRAFQTTQTCPVCLFKLAHEKQSTATIAEHISRQEMQEALNKSSGLCLVHLAAVAEHLHDKETHRWIRALHAEKLETVQRQIHEFIRKHELQFSHEEITNDERESCIVAIDTLVGMNV